MKAKNISNQLAVSLVLSTLLALPLMASAEDNEQRKHKKRKPPAEAFEACKNSSESAACSFTGKRGKSITGQCKMSKSDTLVCAPDRHKHKKKAKRNAD